MGFSDILSKLWTPFNKLTDAEESGYRHFNREEIKQIRIRSSKNAIVRAGWIGFGLYTLTSMFAPSTGQDNAVASVIPEPNIKISQPLIFDDYKIEQPIF